MLAMAVGCVVLARWQWHRLEDRRIDNALISQGLSSEPAALAELTRTAQDGDAVDWRRTTVSGRYDAADQVVVRNRSLSGSTGYYVATPMTTSDGARVWVVRGWIPAGPDARTPSTVPTPPAGVVEVTGYARPFETAVDETGLPPGQIQRLSTDNLQESTSATPFWLQAIDEDPAGRDAPDRLAPPSLSEGPHLGYAVQWVLFSIGAVVGGVVLIRRQREYFESDQNAAIEPDAEG